MKILITIYPFGISEIEMQKLFPGFDVIYNDKRRKLNNEELKEVLKKTNPDIIVAGTEKYTAGELNLCPNLKMISRAGVGVDGVDLAECQKRNIAVTYVPDACTTAVAELTISQMINALRNVQYVSNTWERAIGSSLANSVIGVFGCGRIGKAVIERLYGFKPAKILINDINPDQMNSLKDCQPATKDEILRLADIITFHIPLIEPTLTPKYNNYDFIKFDDLEKCKQTAIIINTSRGGIINEKDLNDWLKNNPGAKAVIDTFEIEPYEGELRVLKNVFATPHLGSCTKEARAAMERGAMSEVQNFINDQELTNCIVNRKNLFSFDMNIRDLKIAIMGLGYVGLPLAVEFGKIQPIVGFDINEARIGELKNFFDRNKELNESELRKAQVKYTSDKSELRNANFIIVAVPTPIDIYKKPDLSPIISASEIIGENLNRGTIIVFESTVYPGVTEDICGPIIERKSGLKQGVDFKLGYSPERTNPGDKEHLIATTIKIVSGEDEEALNVISEAYLAICRAGIYKTKNIKTAEAAKVIENVQRDLNIAIVNELTLIFHRLGIVPKEVFRAAGTKWNYHRYEPGIVGGHCIGVDPFYLTHLSESVGYTPQVILAGRRVNDFMPTYAAELAIKGLIEASKPVLNSKVLILGLTFKENVSDTRNSKVREIIKKLKEYGANVYAYDPLLSADDVRSFNALYVSTLENLSNFDAVVICVAHEQFKALTIDQVVNFMNGKPVIVDIKGLFEQAASGNERLIYKYF